MTLWQRLYLPEIIRGLSLTGRFFFRKKSTLMYPEEKKILPTGYRGVPRLVEAKDGTALRVVTATEDNVPPGREVWLHLPPERCRALSK